MMKCCLLLLGLVALAHALSLGPIEKKSLSSSDEVFQPIEVHLAFTKQYDGMIVTFHAKNYDETVVGKPIVRYSKDKSFKSYQVASVGSVITQYGEIAETGFDISIPLANLDAASIYYYQCGYSNSNVSSEIYKFHTRTNPDALESFDTTVVMYGDQGTTNSKNVIAQTLKFVRSFYEESVANKNLFIYHLGDIGYADDFSGVLYQAIWTKYMHMMSSIMPYVPYMVCVGNHEVGCNTITMYKS